MHVGYSMIGSPSNGATVPLNRKEFAKELKHFQTEKNNEKHGLKTENPSIVNTMVTILALRFLHFLQCDGATVLTDVQ